MQQPNMESDSGDASSVAELQEIVVSPLEDPQTGNASSVAELQENVVPPSEDPDIGAVWLWPEGFMVAQELEIYCRQLLRSSRRSSNPIPIWLADLASLMDDLGGVLENTKRGRNYIMVKLWLVEMKEMFNDNSDIFYEIINTNIFSRTAEVQYSTHKPWKLNLNLFNKISRFKDYYREKRMVSKLKDITIRLGKICEEGKKLFEEIRDGRTQSGLQYGLTTPDPNINHERKQFAYNMRNAIDKGKFWKVRGLFEKNQDAISTTFENGQTALHVAITAGQLMVAKELIRCTRSEKSHQLKIKDESGNTALSFAARRGMMEIAKCLIEKNKDLLTIPDGDNKLPVQLACWAGHEDMTRYLYRNTPTECLKEDYGFYLLEECITKRMFDIAHHLLYSFPKFVIYRILKEGTRSIMLTLAQTQPPFFRGNQLAFWRRWIYNCTRVKVDKGTVLANGVGFIAAQRRATKINDLKLMDAIGREIIHFICRRLSVLNENEFVQSGAVEATFEAIKNGIPEIAIKIAEVNTNILWNSKYTDPEDSRNIFACAIAHRQEEVAQFLYKFNARISTNISFTDDRDGSNLLHLAAKLAPRSYLDHISGAALQLQSELRWFRAVEGIVPQFYNHKKKRGGETPYEVFVEEHKKLLKDAEEWMKKTAESSTFVGALIITIMFAVAFTVPGGNDQNTGFPIFLNKTADSSTVSSPTVPFMVFVASDAISLFAASSSVLMFLGILTSRYAYKDFLKSLPMKLIVGISSLFISIAAMMVAFCVALFIMLQGRLWIIIPVTLFAGVPVIIFVLLQFPFLIELYTSTFRRGIFDGNEQQLRKRRRGNHPNNRFWLSKPDPNRIRL